jgi:hypothetical protein
MSSSGHIAFWKSVPAPKSLDFALTLELIQSSLISVSHFSDHWVCGLQARKKATGSIRGKAKSYSRHRRQPGR